MGILKLFAKSIIKSNDNELFESAGFVAYMALLVFFPFLILLISAASLFEQTDQVQELIYNIQLRLPFEVNEVILPVIESIFEGPAPGLITFSIIGILWLSTSGVESIRYSLNRAYETTENRSFFFRRAQSLVLILFLVTLVLILSFFLVLLPIVVEYIPSLTEDFYVLHLIDVALKSINVADWVEYAVSTVIVSLVFAACYYGLPDHRNKRPPTFPGSVLAALLCVFFSNIFSYYIQNFSAYNAIYKTLAGSVIFLLFMQFCTYFFLLGAQFNRELVRE